MYTHDCLVAYFRIYLIVLASFHFFTLLTHHPIHSFCSFLASITNSMNIDEPNVSLISKCRGLFPFLCMNSNLNNYTCKIQ